MYIRCFIDNLGSGGAQRQMVTLSIEFVRRGHQVSFLTYNDVDFFSSQLRDAGIAVERITASSALQRIARVRAALRGGAQDVVLSFLDTPNLLAELAGLPGRRWGLVVSERNASAARMLSRRGRLQRLLHRTADAVVCNSYTCKTLLDDNFPPLRGRVQTIYNGVDFTRFSPDPAYASRRDGRTHVVVAASYQLSKNTRGVVRALTRLTPEERAALRIDWYGTHTATAETEATYAEAQALIREHRLGETIALHAPDAAIQERYRAADAVGLFSFYEGLPNTICEAMACGKPVVMSAVSDAHRLMDTERGFFCDPTQEASIADALRALLATPDARLRAMGAANRAKAEELFSPSRLADEYLAVCTAAARVKGVAVC
jgi:glycosyltransferase involved in cell wall biosynthesis